MSRPPQQEIQPRRGVIDFVSAPMPSYCSPDEQFMQAQMSAQGYDGGMYTQNYPMQAAAGYSPYGNYVSAQIPLQAQPNFPSNMQNGFQPLQANLQPNLQPIIQQNLQSNMQQMPTPGPNFASNYQYPGTAYPGYTLSSNMQTLSSNPGVNEDSLREKINSKIESIMESQKAQVLSTQIERLTDKVQKLSNHIEINSRMAQASNNISSPRNIASSAPSGEDNISRRLKELAAESSKLARKDDRRSIPNW